ncbi:hypothetical protein K432DRAFT_124385 [Lepidopterella palustris CBS 459.81]|uniref:Uncharacterized protein n=1 Tax=Lepidopterella palustris CBS 459.81 TaxID=1314670 RepID=A0A8E2E4X2_9PEZI|nr:hypothetical protein K432DRAFT_124385 [Lepidopterella palustris CBS 459.81]
MGPLTRDMRIEWRLRWALAARQDVPEVRNTSMRGGAARSEPAVMVSSTPSSSTRTASWRYQELHLQILQRWKSASHSFLVDSQPSPCHFLHCCWWLSIPTPTPHFRIFSEFIYAHSPLHTVNPLLMLDSESSPHSMIPVLSFFYSLSSTWMCA